MSRPASHLCPLRRVSCPSFGSLRSSKNYFPVSPGAAISSAARENGRADSSLIQVLIVADGRPDVFARRTEAALAKLSRNVFLHGLGQGNRECCFVHRLFRLSLFGNR